MTPVTAERHRRRATAAALRQRARRFSRLAGDCRDAWVRTELQFLAEEFDTTADEVETRSRGEALPSG